MPRPEIAILGAGPSGLTLGRLLDVAKIPYIIFERDDSPARSLGRGGTLDIHASSGQVALKEAGLLDQFNSLARFRVSNTLADASAKVHAHDDGKGEQDRPEIDRKDLRTLLLNSIPSNNVRWGAKVKQVKRKANELMSVQFVDGSEESGFQLVVAADGAWSKARDLVTSARPEYSGVHHFTASINPENPFYPSAAALAGEGNYFAFGDQKQLTVQKLSDKSYYISIGLLLPESWTQENTALLDDPTSLKQALLRDWFSTWPQAHTNMIENCEGDIKAWPLYSMPMGSLSWERFSGLTLIGDAAHVTTPFVGEGVNCALYDCLQLAQQLGKHGVENTDQAVQEYEEEMLPRASDLIRRSTESGDLLFAPDAPRGLARDFPGH